MIIIIKGPQGSGKTTLAGQLKKQMLKPNSPDIIEGLPKRKPKGIRSENKIFCAQQDTLPKWAYESPYVIIFQL